MQKSQLDHLHRKDSRLRATGGKVCVRQTLKDFEERRVPIDVHAAIFHRTSRVILFIWAQQDFYRTFSAGQMDRQTLERKKNSKDEL